MKYLIFLVFLVSCQTTEPPETPDVVTLDSLPKPPKDLVCPGTKMIGWASDADTDDIDRETYEIGRAKCFAFHKPYVCLSSLRKLPDLPGPTGKHRYYGMCGLPKNEEN